MNFNTSLIRNFRESLGPNKRYITYHNVATQLAEALTVLFAISQFKRALVYATHGYEVGLLGDATHIVFRRNTRHLYRRATLKQRSHNQCNMRRPLMKHFKVLRETGMGQVA